MNLIATVPERLDRFLAAALPQHSRSKLVKLIQSSGVLVDGKLERASLMLKPGAVVTLEEPEDAPAHDLTPADIPIEVVYEDELLLVVNKPRGLAVHPALSLKEPSLVNALLGSHVQLSTVGGEFRPGIVHRLDKDTTGLLVVAKSDAIHVRLARQLADKSAERRYFAVVGGRLERDRFTVDAPIARNPGNRQHMRVDPKGKRAVSHIKLLKRADFGSVVGVRLETGRTHQIRVHLSAVGLPVFGDRLYAPKEYATGPLQLHAAFLAFEHPGTEKRIQFYVAPDAEFLGSGIVSEADIEPF